jgi:hypothetical protein
MRRFLAGVWACTLLFAAAARAAEMEVDLALVLAVDVSGSVSDADWALQKRGYAEAFRDPAIIGAVTGGPRGAIAVTLVEWSGPGQQEQVIPWTTIRDEKTALAFGGAVAEAPRRFSDSTAIGDAIEFCASLLADEDIAAARRVIDVSGDGPNNAGRPSEQARDAAVARGLTINGLPIVAEEPQVAAAYRDRVIGGPGAFLVVAEGIDSFADAIIKKLGLEIAAARPGD